MFVQIWKLLSPYLSNISFDLSDLSVFHSHKDCEESILTVFESISVNCLIDAMGRCAVINNFTAKIVSFQLSIPAVDKWAGHCNIQVHQADHVLCVHKSKLGLMSIKNFGKSFASFRCLVRELYCSLASFALDQLVERNMSFCVRECLWDKVHYFNWLKRRWRKYHQDNRDPL